MHTNVADDSATKFSKVDHDSCFKVRIGARIWNIQENKQNVLLSDTEKKKKKETDWLLSTY